MQVTLENKQQKIVDDLIQIDRDLQKTNVSDNQCRIRRLIDCRRQLMADLNLLRRVSESSNNFPEKFEYKPSASLIQLIKQWRSQVMMSKPDQQSFENPDFCDQLLDSILPETWNFNTDVMVISAPSSHTIVSTAINRCQSHIVIFDYHKCIDGNKLGYQPKSNAVVCQTITDVEIAFAKLQTPAEQVITVPCSFDPKFLTETKNLLAEAIEKGKKNRIANTITANRFGASWSKNLLKNLHLIAKTPNIHQLSVKGVKDAVIVGSGPSLNKNVHTLAGIQDQVFIVAALRSIQTLHEANIQPDLVIQLDAEDDQVAKEFSTKLDIQIENFLVELTVNPWFLESNANNFIWSYPSIFSDIGRTFGVAPTPFDAPSVAIYGLTLCYLLGFESLCFVGQDLASSNKLQYAKGATSLLPAHNNISTFNIEVDGFYGDKVMTRSAYHGQLIRCINIASELSVKAPHIHLFNATEGGAYIKGFKHLSLSEFVTSRNLKKNRCVKQLIWAQHTKVKPTQVTDYLAYITDTMDNIITIANTIIKLDTASGRTMNEDTEIHDLIKKFHSLDSATSLLQIAMQEEISSVIGTSNNARNQSSFSEFFKKIIQHAEELKSIAVAHGA